MEDEEGMGGKASKRSVKVVLMLGRRAFDDEREVGGRKSSPKAADARFRMLALDPPSRL